MSLLDISHITRRAWEPSNFIGGCVSSNLSNGQCPSESGPPYWRTTYKGTLILTSFTEKSTSQLRHNNFPHDIHGMFCRHSAIGGNAHCANTLKLLICLAFVSFLVPTVVALKGTYVIQSRANPNLVIGADIKGTSDEKKVITDGDMVVVRPSPLVFFPNGARISQSSPDSISILISNGDEC